jgi:hypothetical protein
LVAFIDALSCPALPCPAALLTVPWCCIAVHPRSLQSHVQGHTTNGLVASVTMARWDGSADKVIQHHWDAATSPAGRASRQGYSCLPVLRAALGLAKAVSPE